MISLDFIMNFYPTAMRENTFLRKHMLKEYIQLLVLDYLSAQPVIRKITFIGGTNLRLIKKIDRFSEDLDFDCKNLSKAEFLDLSEDILEFLKRNGLTVEIRDKPSPKLTAFRCSIYFPELLFQLGLSGHWEERFMLKLEAQNQGVEYQPEMRFVKGCGFFFSIPVPPDPVLCSMKISAMLDRGKGRDFYDSMFLLSQTAPDYRYLSKCCNISNIQELQTTVENFLQSVDLHHKHKDFEHMLIHTENSRRILGFQDFIRSLS